ncbi:MAG: response regulator [Thermoflexales bacterium]|nr:response regulator [Thermoflexales bacterium]
MSELNILVVDDEPSNLRVMAQVLQGGGYMPRCVRSGEAAIEAAEADPPDLILLDIRMPGMDGYEVCTRLKRNELTCDIPIIFISALGEAEDKVKAFEAGGVDYIAKPFQPVEVLARVKTHLTLRQLQVNLERMAQDRTEELGRAYCRLRQLDRTRGQFVAHVAQEILVAPPASLPGIARDLMDVFGSGDSEAFLNWLNDELQERGWSMRELSRRMGFSVSTVSRVLNGEQNPSGDFCQGLADAFNVPVNRVLWQAGLLAVGDRTELIDVCSQTRK